MRTIVLAIGAIGAALQARRHWPNRLVKLAFGARRLVETLQWHRYRDPDPSSQWLRDKIVAQVARMPAPEALVV